MTMKTQAKPSKPGAMVPPEMTPGQRQNLVAGAQTHVGSNSTGSGETPYRQALMARLRVAERPFIEAGE